eukprot:TRINITY_DN66440_c10_g2_i1.p1 TRINITY_DN66440_c10_g2~~TRINITY_DN66440_c10_g2_i1.p1  ORF type:complete len:1050 (+),score=610.68 TRINITY_DN66440_c10_g2_i1:23-3172(+)
MKRVSFGSFANKQQNKQQRRGGGGKRGSGHGGGGKKQKGKKKKHASLSGDVTSRRTHQRKGLAQLGSGSNSNNNNNNNETASPFEVIYARPKHEVLNKKQRGNVKNVGKARSKAIQRRQESLLREFATLDKANKFVDRRFGIDKKAAADGEEQQELSAEDIALQKFARERQQRLSKQARYRLDEEDNDVLTHGGAAIGSSSGSASMLDSWAGDSDSDEDHRLGVEGHFGGGESSGNVDEARKARSFKEVMEEVILKSKYHRAERHAHKLEMDDMVQELDEGFGDIRDLIEAKSTDERRAEKEAIEDNVDDDEFTRHTKKFAQDARAEAAERGKSEEQKAAEARQELERLERERLRRMRGEVPASQQVAASEASTSSGKADKATKRQRLTGAGEAAVTATDDSADALRDDAKDAPRGLQYQTPDEALGISNRVAVGDGVEDAIGGNYEMDPQFQEESSDADSDYDDVEFEADGDGVGDDDVADVASDDETAHLTMTSAQIRSLKRKRGASKKADDSSASTSSSSSSSMGQSSATITADGELPYTLNAPRSYVEFKRLLDVRPPEEFSEIVQRIIRYNHPKLSTANMNKMVQFFSILLEHFRHLTTVLYTEEQRRELDDAVLRQVQSQVDLVVHHVYALTEMMPTVGARLFRERLAALRKVVLKRVGKSRVAMANGEPVRSCLPDGHHLMFLKMLANVFPTSDFRHNVVVPALFLLSECLSRVPLYGGLDVAKALFVCQLIVHYVRTSRRFVPELVCFVQELLGTVVTLPSDVKGDDKTLPVTFMHDRSGVWPSSFISDLVAANETKKNKKKTSKRSKKQQKQEQRQEHQQVPPLAVSALFKESNDDKFFATTAFRQSALVSTLKMVHRVARLYSMATSFPEMFAPTLATLNELSERAAAAGLSDDSAEDDAVWVQLQITREYVQRRTEASEKTRRPMVQMVRSKPLKQLKPLVAEGFRPDKDLDPDKARAEMKKLAKRVKREKKGALRELRRDTAFVSQQKDIQRQRATAERRAKQKQIQSILQVEARDSNIWNRMKKKLRKMGGGEAFL